MKAAIERSFASIGKTIVCETAAPKGLGEALKALIPPGVGQTAVSCRSPVSVGVALQGCCFQLERRCCKPYREAPVGTRENDLLEHK